MKGLVCLQKRVYIERGRLDQCHKSGVSSKLIFAIRDQVFCSRCKEVFYSFKIE